MGLKNFTSAEKDIYLNFNPAMKNLFTIKILEDSDEKLNAIAEFHATSVRIDDEVISLKRNEISKNFQIDDTSGYQWANKLTIKWRENNLWEVKRFHEEWISTMYDKDRDVYKSFDPNSKGPYKTFLITLPNDRAIKCYQVLPRNIGGIDLSWSNSPATVEHNLDYYLTKWEWTDHKTDSSDEELKRWKSMTDHYRSQVVD